MNDKVRKHKDNLVAFIKMGMSLEEAIDRQVDPDDPDLLAAAELVRGDTQEIFDIDKPTVIDRSVSAETAWYPGPSALDKRWTHLRTQLRDSIVDSVDASSSKVVSRLSCPWHLRMKKRGLVLGYVQSGKTANYAATIAKAADAGYKLVIVLAGLHDNLRSQTQARLDRDLGLGVASAEWTSLTTLDSDFQGSTVGTSVLRADRSAVIVVVKKNKRRLVRLLNWLKSIPVADRERGPVLILDDEADQATPNSSGNRATITAINKVIRQIWEQIPTGTYLAYTATPFANVFMDPEDEDDLFPADFIIDLPRPDNYFGAERIFGSEGVAEGASPDDGLDMVRSIPLNEAQALRPSRQDKADFVAELPPSALSALRWFLVACAIRRARGQDGEHSSMLLHTSQFVDAHGAIAEAVTAFLEEVRNGWECTDPAQVAQDSEFHRVFLEEAPRAAEVASEPLPRWEDVAAHLPFIALDVKVIIDNGQSEDRLNYTQRDPEGHPVPQTVIAIGGQTLSRGLTLEGLIVSYFARPATTYDTLLQMGRWFGYRMGYEDLPRVWMTDDLKKEFLFLATVEQDLRDEISYLERTGKTPYDAGVRVREHPGRLAITNSSRMVHANKVQIGLSHSLQQTIVFDPADEIVIGDNRAAVVQLVQAAVQDGRSVEAHRNGRSIIRDVSCRHIRDLIRTFHFHPNQSEMMPTLIDRWLGDCAPDSLWNVVIASSARGGVTDADGTYVELGTMDLGLAQPVQTVSRAPMAEPKDAAYIKALIGLQDRIADMPEVATKGWKHADFIEHRMQHADGRGLLVVVPVSKDSPPTRRVGTAPSSRRPMDAAGHLVGLGILYPPGKDAGLTSNDWVSVRPRYDSAAADDQDENAMSGAEGDD